MAACGTHTTPHQISRAHVMMMATEAGDGRTGGSVAGRRRSARCEPVLGEETADRQTSLHTSSHVRVFNT